MADAPFEIEAAGRELAVSNPNKLYFSERGETKLDLVRYYLAVEAPLMRALGGRPMLMERYPEGAGGPSFFQKRVPKNAPDWLETTTVADAERHAVAGPRHRGRRPHRLGGEPGLPRAPRVAVPGRRPRPFR